MRRLAVHGFACDLPPQWEVTAYKLGADNGEFRLNRRLVPMGRLLWMRAAAPDLERFVTEAIGNESLVLDGETRPPAAIRRIGPWTVAWGGPGRTCHAVTCVAHDDRLLHWTFPEFTESTLEQVWTPLLISFQATGGSHREWSLFGIHAHLTREFTIFELDARPAVTVLTMQRKDGLRVRLRRLGMAEVLLRRAPLHHLYRGLLAADRIKVGAIDVIGYRRCPAVHADFTVQGEQALERMIWRRRPGEGMLWHHVADNALYGVEQVGPRRAQRLDLPVVWGSDVGQ